MAEYSNTSQSSRNRPDRFVQAPEWVSKSKRTHPPLRSLLRPVVRIYRMRRIVIDHTFVYRPKKQPDIRSLTHQKGCEIPVLIPAGVRIFPLLGPEINGS